MRTRIAVFILVIQSILFLAHWFVYQTWVTFWGKLSFWGTTNFAHGALQIAVVLLSISFVSASVLAFFYSNVLVRLFYKIAAVWLGVFSFFLLAACASWVVAGAVSVLGLHWERRPIVATLFGMAILVSLYGMINAAWTRVTQISVTLPNLPESWRGRVAALVSDTHLGHIRNYGFVRRIVGMLARLQPDLVFIGGDMYDGTSADLHRLAEPWGKLAAPLGTYFVAGNHDGFGGHARHIEAVEKSGIRVLNNEKVIVDGVQIVGVHYHDSVNEQRFRSILRGVDLDRDQASILLTHVPNRLPIAEEEGIGLSLSGHTHGGQFFPYTWIVSRIWGQASYGLKRLGNLLFYTSSGAGTWGPPMRVGTTPEIVLIRFE